MKYSVYRLDILTNHIRSMPKCPIPNYYCLVSLCLSSLADYDRYAHRCHGWLHAYIQAIPFKFVYVEVVFIVCTNVSSEQQQ